MTKPTFDRIRPLSWSAISSFEYDPEQWYRKYVLGIEEKPNAAMLFGKTVGERIAKDPTFLPHLSRLSHFEFELHAHFCDIPLLGYIDSYEPHEYLFEYKTGKRGKNEWTQKKADTHGQIDMYLLLLWLKYRVKPYDVACTIFWMPTKEGSDFNISFIDEKKIQAFPTVRNMHDITNFGLRINKRYKEMIAYCENHE